MTKDELLAKLREACDNLVAIGNLQEFITHNPDKDALFGILQPVVQYYGFIRDKYPEDNDLQITARTMVEGIGVLNPSLVRTVFEILNPNKEERQTKKEFLHKFQTNMEYIQNNYSNPEKIDECETMLSRLKDKLEENMGMLLQVNMKN